MSEYTLFRELTIASGSASPFGRNLTVYSGKAQASGAVAHRNQVNVVSWDQAKMEGMTQDVVHVKEPNSVAETDSAKVLTVLQVNYCHVRSRPQPVLAIATNLGVGIYECNGSTQLCWQELPKMSNSDTSMYSKGIDYINDYIVIGTSNGDLWYFSVSTRGAKYKGNLSFHKQGIMDVCSDHHRAIASVATDGVICLWDSELKLTTDLSTGHPVSCIALHKGLLIAATVLGGIFIYESSRGELLCDIAAHARPINSLDVAPEGDLILSASEDSFVRVWKILKTDPFDIECHFSESLPNVPLVGGTFVDPRGKEFALTGFDYASIYYFKKSK